MGPAARRRRLLAVAGDELLAVAGDPGERRGMALLRSLAGTPRHALTLDQLLAAPDWQRLPRRAQARLAQRAALASIAGALADSIDGDWLGGHARVAGDDGLDWAIEAAPELGGVALPPIAGDALEARGFSLMRAALPPALRPLLDWAPAEATLAPDAATAERCVAVARNSLA